MPFLDMYHNNYVASYLGLPTFFFNVSQTCETLKNMGRPGYEAMYIIICTHILCKIRPHIHA